MKFKNIVLTKALSTILFLALSNNGIFAQQIENLVMEGAGVRGIIYTGAIKALEEKNLLPAIKNVGGTSAGGIVAFMLAIGYNSAEMDSILANTPIQKFNDGSWYPPQTIKSIKNKFGFNKGIAFTKWLEKLLEQKKLPTTYTFNDLYLSLPNNKQHKNLFVTGTNVSNQCTQIFSHEAFPNMRLVDAVRISMSIPGVFESVFMMPDGKIVTEQSDSTCVMCDGGVLANFPITMFDSSKYQNNFNGTNNYAFNYKTIGLKVDRSAQLKYDSASGNKKSAPFKIESVGDYFTAIYYMTSYEINDKKLTLQDNARVITINDHNIKSRIKKLPKDEKETMWLAGYEAANSFLNIHNVKNE
jgi:NTE family protein